MCIHYARDDGRRHTERQVLDVDRDPSLYDDEVDARSRTWFNQLLFSQKLNPQTVFFLGYSDNYAGAEWRYDLTTPEGCSWVHAELPHLVTFGFATPERGR